MESFSINMARAFLGKNVNLHLKDGSVIINVQLEEIHRNELGREVFVTCIPYRNSKRFKVSLKSIAWAELLNLNLLTTSG